MFQRSPDPARPVPPGPHGAIAVDIAFVLDASGSMDGCLKALQRQIVDFVEEIAKGAQSKIDARLAFVAHDSGLLEVLDFVPDVNKFSRAILAVHTRGNEYTLPAIDWALDLAWRPGVHKVVVVLTDEPVAGGDDVEGQRRGLPALIDKIAAMRALLYVVAPECPEFRQLTAVRKARYIVVRSHEELNGAGFGEILGRIAGTVSASVRQSPQAVVAAPPRDIFGVAGRITIKNI